MRERLVADVIVGGYLGDEGKGKLVGAVGHGYDAVLRVNASTNAGHTVVGPAGAFVTRQLPSVFFPERTLLVIAPGALLNPLALDEELAGRPDLAALRGRLQVASSVSLVIRPYLEKGRGAVAARLGSTHQGAGPAAAARAARHSLRLFDVAAAGTGGAARAELEEKLRLTCKETLPERFTDAGTLAAYAAEVADELVAAVARVAERVGPFVVDYTALLGELRRDRRLLLVEGCNGLLLDNLHGALPHVTGTSTNVGALLAGANLAPADVGRVIVVVAAYATCLGRRPFPTELDAAESEHFFRGGGETDVAEGVRRRIGWLDVPGLRKALVGSAGAELHLNKLDVLSGLLEIRVCTAYDVDGERVDVLPDDPRRAARARPRYETLPGWSEPLAAARRLDDLPPAARAYVRRLGELLPLPITSLGVGRENEAIVRV